MKAQSVVEVELKSGNIKRISTEKRVDVFKEKCGKLYEDLNLPNLAHEQRTKRTSTIETSRIKGELWEVWDDTENKKLHKIKQLDLVEDLDIGDKRVFEIQRIEYDTCGFCGHPLIAEDYSKGVRVCEGCGSVEGTFVFEKPSLQSAEDLPETDKLRQDEWDVIYLERRRKARIESTKDKKIKAPKPKQNTDMKVYRRNQYLLAVNSICSQLHMTPEQQKKVKTVICSDRYKLKDFHGNAGYKAIIAGLCRFVIKSAGRSDGDLRFSLPAFRDNNLDKKRYNIIALNIVERRIMSLM